MFFRKYMYFCGMKTRVLEVIRQGDVGGSESQVIDLTLGLKARGNVEPAVLAFTDGTMMSQLREHGISCHVIPSMRVFDPAAYAKVKDLIKAEQIDLVHVHDTRAACTMLTVCRRAQLPMVYTVHGWSFHDGQSMLCSWLRRMCERHICRQASRVICVSQNILRTGHLAFGLDTDRCTVIEHGVNLQHFAADGQYPDLRTQLGFSSDDFVCTYICRITGRKAPLDFAKAIIAAHEREPRIRALMVGEGDMADNIDHYIKERAREDIFVRLPFRDDVPALLAATDLFCLPSLHNDVSIAMLEAMAMRKAMVVTLTDGTRDIIQDHRNAIIVPAAQPEQLTEAILEAAASPELCQRMGQRACALVRQRFDAALVTEQVEKIYKDILKTDE